MNFLCIASFFKGEDFIKACHLAGANVYLLTSKKLENKAWPWEHITDTFYIEDENDNWNMNDVIAGLAWKFRSINFDRVVALDDFDVEKGALIRETFRIPGMGQTTARYYRDKLAMRLKAKEEGINIPKFSALFNDQIISDFLKSISFPLIIKPRGEASATGLKKINDEQEFWKQLDTLGNNRYQYLVEEFKPGTVYHVDALSNNGKVIFESCSKYLNTPFEVAHYGGIFQSVTLSSKSEEFKKLAEINAQVLKGFDMNYSASHTEFIKCDEDGKYYFLETSSRVGGAHLAEMVMAATGINLWAEWAKLEIAIASHKKYTCPAKQNNFAGIIISLAKQEWPDMAEMDHEALFWKINKSYHVGCIVKSKKQHEIDDLLNKYLKIIIDKYHASAPVPDKPLS